MHLFKLAAALTCMGAVALLATPKAQAQFTIPPSSTPTTPSPTGSETTYLIQGNPFSAGYNGSGGSYLDVALTLWVPNNWTGSINFNEWIYPAQLSNLNLIGGADFYNDVLDSALFNNYPNYTGEGAGIPILASDFWACSLTDVDGTIESLSLRDTISILVPDFYNGTVPDYGSIYNVDFNVDYNDTAGLSTEIIGTQGVSFDNTANGGQIVNVSNVPEPSDVALFGTAALSLAVFAARRPKKASGKASDAQLIS